MLVKIVLVYLLLINILTFFVYGIDKRKAMGGKWRIPEKYLLLFAVAGGSIGALAGMRIWRHKTSKIKFYVGVPAILILQIAFGGFVFLKIHGAIK